MDYTKFTREQILELYDKIDFKAAEELVIRILYGIRGFEKDHEWAYKILQWMHKYSYINYKYLVGHYYITEKKIEKAIPWLIEYAEENYPDIYRSTYCLIAYQYEKLGQYDKAFEYYTKGAKFKDPVAFYQLSFYYQDRHDYKKMIECLQKASDMGDVYAIGQLGHYYLTAVGVPYDPAKAYEYFRYGAEKGDLYCKVYQAYCILYGYGTQCNPKRGFKMLHDIYYLENSQLETGSATHANLCLFLGQCYDAGYAVEKDYQQAFYYYQSGANDEDCEINYRVALCYYYGRGIHVDYQLAYIYAEKAVKACNGVDFVNNKGDYEALYKLAKEKVFGY